MLVEYKDFSNIKIFVFSNYMHFKLITKHVLTLDKEKCNLMATKVLFDDKCTKMRPKIISLYFAFTVMSQEPCAIKFFCDHLVFCL